MTSGEPSISHVSDTALMVAACRAMETMRADGLVRDPFAERLAGERGMAIARGMGRAEMMCFGIGMRSRFLDQLLLHAVNELRVGTVLSLGAGLDTRPWRVDLPAKLEWIEVDFPAMLEYKYGILAGEEPRCALQRISADLNNPEERLAAFANIRKRPALMITEGLLMYLPAGTVEALAVESPAAGVEYWLTDISSAALARRIHMDSCQSINAVRAPDCLEGAETLALMERKGWSAARRLSYITDAYLAAPGRVQEIMKSMAASGSPPSPPDPADPSGVHLLRYGLSG